MAQKNSPPRSADALIGALNIMRTYVASKPDWLVEAPQAAQIEATALDLQNAQAQIALLEAQLSSARSTLQEKMALGSGYYCGVRDEIYRKYGKDSDELLSAGLVKLDLEMTDDSEPPRSPAILSVEEVTPTSVRIKIQKVANAKDYKYFMGTTSETNAMTMKDTSTKTTFIYEGLTEGTKYFFAVKARNTAGESAFSTVANRRTY